MAHNRTWYFYQPGWKGLTYNLLGYSHGPASPFAFYDSIILNCLVKPSNGFCVIALNFLPMFSGNSTSNLGVKFHPKECFHNMFLMFKQMLNCCRRKQTQAVHSFHIIPVSFRGLCGPCLFKNASFFSIFVSGLNGLFSNFYLIPGKSLAGCWTIRMDSSLAPHQ